MSNPLPVASQTTLQFTEDQVALIKRTIAPTATDDELKLFLHQAKRMGLDPLAKQIYFQKFGGRMTIIVSIDGYRLTADRTGTYAGNDDPYFDDEKNPSKASVTVYKMVAGVRCPFTATARWDQYCPPPPRDHMWKKFPHLMLGKVAESLALRKAFPAELGGSYTNEELEQADRPEVIEARATSHDTQTGEVFQLTPKGQPIPIEDAKLEQHKIAGDLSDEELKKSGDYVIQFSWAKSTDNPFGKTLSYYRRPEQIGDIPELIRISWGNLQKIYDWTTTAKVQSAHLMDFQIHFQRYKLYFDRMDKKMDLPF